MKLINELFDVKQCDSVDYEEAQNSNRNIAKFDRVIVILWKRRNHFIYDIKINSKWTEGSSLDDISNGTQYIS